MESNDKVPIPIDSICGDVGGIFAVGIDSPLGNQRQPSQDSRMPLNDMVLLEMSNDSVMHTDKQVKENCPSATYQGVRLCLHKVIAPIQWIGPDIEEEVRELSLSNHKTPSAQIRIVKGKNELYILRGEVREGLDDAIWRYDRNVLEH